MKIGILELGGSHFNPLNLAQSIDHFFTRKQYASIMPQAISVWCRQMGHSTYYAFYYGLGDPKTKLPDNLDIIFICAHTCLAPLAYALAKAFKQAETLTVIGGPHAKSYPHDCLRYFDLVVLECDKDLVADIVERQFDSHQIITSSQPLVELPTIEERILEIRASSFLKGKPFPGSFISILASLGCPYTCNFCTDWDNPYRPLDTDKFKADLEYVSRNFPGTLLGFYDPNFGIKFDEVLAAFESIPTHRRNPYLIQSSLTLLNPQRINRLHNTNCKAIAPGIESWMEYSNKSGVGKAVNRQKMESVIDQFYVLQEYIPYLGANFILGLDTDEGDAPFELTEEFLHRVPFVWPSINIPMAFGGTPLFDTFFAENRILPMPFTFYEIPALTVILKNYDPIVYFQKIVNLYALIVSPLWLKRRMASATHWQEKGVHYMRTVVARGRFKLMKNILHQLQTDSHFYAFHLGETQDLPDFYAAAYARQLGKYIELVPLSESRPILTQPQEIST